LIAQKAYCKESALQKSQFKCTSAYLPTRKRNSGRLFNGLISKIEGLETKVSNALRIRICSSEFIGLKSTVIPEFNFSASQILGKA
jgi:hypothetical protein